MTQKRAIVVDHMAVLPYGHNVEALRLYETELRQRGMDVLTLVSTNLPKQVEGAEDYHRVLAYPYNGHVEAIRKYRDFPKVAKNYESNLRRRIDAVKFRAPHLVGLDVMGSRIRSNWRSVLRKFKVTSGDWIFFPSVDHYGLLCLIEVLQTLPIERRPAVHGRLIGVMEGYSYSREPARNKLFRAILAAQKAGINITMSAETPIYQDYVSSVLNMDIGYLTYPCIAEYTKVDWKQRPFMLSSPGQGRPDKGYMRLLGIREELRRHFARGELLLSTQSMRKDDRSFSPRHQALLKAKIDLEVRPERLSSSEITQMYQSAHLLILPYAQDIYAFRGSAVYQEGLAHGRLVVTFNNTGVSSMVDRYGNGMTVKDDRTMADAIYAISQKPAKWVHDTTKKARDAYQADFAASFDAVLAAAFEKKD